jgi:hypothetical protein
MQVLLIQQRAATEFSAPVLVAAVSLERMQVLRPVLPTTDELVQETAESPDVYLLHVELFLESSLISLSASHQLSCLAQSLSANYQN